MTRCPLHCILIAGAIFCAATATYGQSADEGVIHLGGSTSEEVEQVTWKPYNLGDSALINPASPWPPVMPIPQPLGETWSIGTHQLRGGHAEQNSGYCPPIQQTSTMPTMAMPKEKKLFVPPSDFHFLGYRLFKPAEVWGRIEYLHWGWTDPPNNAYGAQFFYAQGTSVPTDPTTTFNLGNSVIKSDGTALTNGLANDLGLVSLSGTNGIRGTFGVPLNTGAAFEFSGFVLEQRGFEYARATPPAVALPVTANLFPTDILPVFTEGAVYSYAADAWGLDFDFVIDPLSPPGDGFHIQPTFGFAYRAVQEQQGAEYINFNGTNGTVTGITTDVHNNIWGPTVGARFELIHKWLTLGTEPSVLLGVNNVKSRVIATNFLGFSSNRSRNDFLFSPVFEFDVYARIKINPKARLIIGYDLMRFSHVVRPADNTTYDITTANGGRAFISNINNGSDSVTGINFAPGKSVKVMSLDGISVGLEFGPW
ncbi:hypothetical protein Pan189_17830 [Stratiformator vulcanicus]|uniref:Uncharacterized protein n=2 Tax=Stratiformator vulcanicus TaxID=2527980 RepID=A0A517R0N9_9PLAN|nr:hypothetical protein Pan189_17830 [Stratiformator vulcanicus]